MIAARIGAALLLGASLCLPASASERPVQAVRVAYHVDGGLEQASRALRMVRNQLAEDPGAKIVVVGIGSGIDFMLRGAEDAGGYPYELIIEQLVEQGVGFVACGNTLMDRELAAGALVEQARIVRAGAAELSRLQSTLGYAYIKP